MADYRNILITVFGLGCSSYTEASFQEPLPDIPDYFTSTYKTFRDRFVSLVLVCDTANDTRMLVDDLVMWLVEN